VPSKTPHGPRGKSPGRPPSACPVEQNSQPTPSRPSVNLQFLWFYFNTVGTWMYGMLLPILPVETITGLITRLETWVYGLLLPTLSADVEKRLRTSSLRVLELSDNATEKDIDKAKRDLSARYHPDRKSQHTDQEIKEVNNAVDFLTKFMPLDLDEATHNLASAIVKFVLTMLVLIGLRYNPVLGGDVFMMNPYTIEFFGRTYAQWPSLMSIISSTVITYCMGGILVFPSVMILREYFYISSTIEWVLMYIPWCSACIAKLLPEWISWFPSIFTWLFTWIIWMIMIVLRNTLRFCDNWWTFHFIPLGQFVTLVWCVFMWYIHTHAFYNKYNPSQAIVLVENVLLIFGLIAVMGVLLVWARM